MNRSRWEGTFPSAGTQGCADGKGCSCLHANANASDYSDAYILFLNTFFMAQVKYINDISTNDSRPRLLQVPGDGFIGKSL
jgi:hypothetical protein